MQENELQVASNGAEYVPYNEPGYPVYAGKGSLHDFKNMGAVDHWHWDMEFVYVLTGAMSYAVNGKTMTVHEGEGIFINSGQIHRNFSSDGTDGEYRCVLIHPSVLQTPFQKAMNALKELNSFRNVPYILLQPKVPWQESLIEDINGLYENIMSGVEENIFAILARAYSIAHTLLCNVPRGSSEGHNAHDLDSIREMMGYIQLHFAEKIRVSDISHAGKVGNSTCHTLFRRLLGTSPIKYLFDYRMEKATYLLGNTNASVSEIAEMTGFSSQSYFAECFRAKYSMSPTDYRNDIANSLYPRKGRKAGGCP